MQKNKNRNQLILLLLVSGVIFSCGDENLLSTEISQVESEFSKASETKASPEEILVFVQEMDREIERQLIEREGIAKTETITDYDIGLPSNGDPGSCPNFENPIVTISMDCENSNGATNVSVIQGASGGSFPWTVTSSSGSIVMRFCRVDGRIYGSSGSGGLRYGGRHAVLKLGAIGATGSGIKQLTRYFDNEDSNNSNSSSGGISPNVVNSNTTLLFQIIPPALDPNGAYNKGSYPYVIATVNEFPVVIPFAPLTPLATYRYYIDDEDNRNKNNWRINNGGATSSSGETCMSGDKNTEIRIMKIN